MKAGLAEEATAAQEAGRPAYRFPAEPRCGCLKRAQVHEHEMDATSGTLWISIVTGG